MVKKELTVMRITHKQLEKITSGASVGQANVKQQAPTYQWNI